MQVKRKGSSVQYMMRIIWKKRLVQHLGTFALLALQQQRDQLVRRDNPFLMGLMYSFQTQDHVYMVFPMVLDVLSNINGPIPDP